MSQVKGFRFPSGSHVGWKWTLTSHHWASGYVGDLQHFHLDPPLGMAHWIWSLWPQWGSDSGWPDFEPGSSSGGGAPFRTLFMVRSWCKSSISLNGFSPRQEESHACWQGRFTAQPLIEVEPDLPLGVFFSWGGGSTLPCPTHGLLSPSLQLQVSCMETQSLNWRTRTWGLGDDDEDCLQHSGKGLWCHLDLLLPLDWECHFCDSDHPLRESSLGHLVASLVHGSAGGEWVLEAEQPQEHLLLLEGLIELGAPFRPALAMHLLNSCCYSLMQPSCWWWESILGAKVHSPW